MPPAELRRHRVGILLVSSGIMYLLYIYTPSSVTDAMFGVGNGEEAPWSERKPHVRVLFGTNLNPRNLFTATLNQTHRLLGTKRDYVDNFDEVVLEKRKNHVTRVCSLLKQDPKAVSEILHPLMYYNKTNLLYCPVAKVASNFWSRMLHVLDTDDHISPFEFEFAHRRFLRYQTKSMIEGDRNQYIKNTMASSFKFVFSRDPYERIYSSYLDKLFSPNPAYWKLRRNIVLSVRNSSFNENSPCGYNVTFNELVKYLVANDPSHYDLHFRPVSVVCDVCRIHYDFIGKIETFKHDVMYIVNSTHKKGIVFKDFSQEHSIHYIVFTAKRAFTFKEDFGKIPGTLNCVSDHEVHLRLWRILQIAGLIEKHDSYPLTPEESRQASLQALINLLLNAYHRSTSGARLNKREAFLQAYSQVSLYDLDKLRLKYMKDFMVFDYDDKPDILFRKSKLSQPADSFDYFDGLH